MLLFDADEQIELWGKYLAEELPTIYAEQAAAVVVFISAEYATRDWTRLERRAALNSRWCPPGRRGGVKIWAGAGLRPAGLAAAVWPGGEDARVRAARGRVRLGG